MVIEFRVVVEGKVDGDGLPMDQPADVVLNAVGQGGSDPSRDDSGALRQQQQGSHGSHQEQSGGAAR